MSIPHYHVANQLNRAAHAMGVTFDTVVRPLGITSSQIGVLLYIDRFPEATMAKLADLAAITPQTMQRIIISLERRGLIQRNRKSDNKKSYYISLTLVGAQLLRQAEIILKAEQDVLKEYFQPQELDTLNLLLQKFEAAFQKNRKKGETNEREDTTTCQTS